MKQKSQIRKQKRINLLIIISLIFIPTATALPFQGHPGSEIAGEITEAIIPCDKIQQSDITDDTDFCVDVDTRCTMPGLCTQLCLGDICINSFTEVAKACNGTGVCDQLCIGSTCITSFGELGGGGSGINGTCTQGFIKGIDESGNIICQKVISADIYDNTIIGTNILDNSIESADILDGTLTIDDLSQDVMAAIGADYCAAGTCAGDLSIPGKLDIITTTSDHPLTISSSDNAVIDISSSPGKFSSLDLWTGTVRKWGIGKDPDNNFYIGEPGDNWLVIESGGNVGIGTASPSAKLDVAGTIKQNGNQVCDNSNNCGYLTSFTEEDPYIYDMTADKWCRGTGVGVTCDQDPYWTKVGDNVYKETGNVGIGTTNPGAKLHVNGDLQVDGNIQGQGFCIGTDCKSSWDSISGLIVGGGRSIGASAEGAYTCQVNTLWGVGRCSGTNFVCNKGTSRLIIDATSVGEWGNTWWRSYLCIT